ncbi:MAG TPA: HD domain-containing protein [Pantanalinema sp.]
MIFTDRVRDPIHGLIPLTACERDLLRTRPFSRLRGVRQMGMAYVVYPGAHHTRYEHVIGAMHTAWLLSEHLGSVFSEQDLRLIRLGALCHDLGHRPFSHSLEDAARRYAAEPEYAFLANYLDHEEHTRLLVETDPEIGEVLERHPGYRDLDRRDIALVAIGEHPRAELNFFTHSEIDADRIDYVLRDNYYCGFTHGIDTQSLLDLYVPDPEQGLVLSAQHTYVASQLLSARFNLISNIQNNPRSRLGDLLLARCIRQALHGADAERREVFDRVVNVGQDSDLEQFLRQHAPFEWGQMAAMVGGREPFRELTTYDFSVLSPLARFALRSLQVPGRSVAQQLEARLNAQTRGSYLVDRLSISPPTDPLPVSRSGHAPWHGRLTELPTVQGIVDASLEGIGLRVYVPSDAEIEPDAAHFAEWVKAYRRLDASMDETKAEGILAELWGGDRVQFGLLLALEEVALDLLTEQVGHGPSRLALLFLTCYAALESIARAVGDPRIYLDGREAVLTLLRHPALRAILAPRFSESYAGTRASGALLNDLRYLERCGLVYAPARVERVRNVFVRRPKYGSTGWGKRLFRTLAEPAESRAYVDSLEAAMKDLFEPYLDAYREYFGMLDEEGVGNASRRRELRRQMPVPFTR